MRRVLGIGIVLLAVAGFGLWAALDRAQRIEATIATQAQEIARSARHRMTVEVSGRDIFVRGVADSQEERDRMLAALAEVPGQRLIYDELEILPQGVPFTFAARRDGAGLTLEGMISSETDRAVLADQVGDAAEALRVMGGAPEGWVPAVGQGLNGLAALKTGRFLMSDTDVRLSGLASLPTDREAALAAFAALPDGFTFTPDIEVEDDGRPFTLNAAFDGTRLILQGKVPRGMQVGLLARSRAVGAVNGALDEARIDDTSGTWPDIAITGLEALGALDDGALAVAGNIVNLSGRATAEGQEQAFAALDKLPDGVRVNSEIMLLKPPQDFPRLP